MDNKLTDTEIIKALECCTNSFYNGFAKCEECPKFTEMSGCTIKLMCNALDLINRQKAEIERLQKEKARLHQLIPKMIKEAKSEATKEFWNKLKNTSQYHEIDNEFYIIECDGDNLVKEFLNEDTNEKV